MKLFIAGCEAQNNRLGSLTANNPNMLLSYYHLTSNKHRMDKAFVSDYQKLKNTNSTFITDSGLFTMMFGAGSHKTYTESDLMEYTDRYIDNMLSIGYEDYIVEMDVHKLLGIEALQRFRNKFITRYPIEKTIFVWHIEETIEGWKTMCKTFPYIALSIPELRKVLQKKYLKNFIAKMIKMALAINPDIKIHLLGCTSNDLLQQSGYYSVDSTSWQEPLRFGSCSVPHLKISLSKEQLSDLCAIKRDDIAKNEVILLDKYSLTNPDPNRERVEKGLLSISFYRHMAEIVSRDFFNEKYELFDNSLIDIVKTKGIK